MSEIPVPKLTKEQKTWLAAGIVLLIISISILVYFFYFLPAAVVTTTSKLSIRAVSYYGPEGEQIPDSASIPLTVLDSDYQVVLSAILDKDNSFATSADITSPAGWVLIRAVWDGHYFFIDNAEEVEYNGLKYYNITLEPEKTNVIIKFASVATVSGVVAYNASVVGNSSLPYVAFNMSSLSMLRKVNITISINDSEIELKHLYVKIGDGPMTELSFYEKDDTYYLEELITLDNHNDHTTTVFIFTDLYGNFTTDVKVTITLQYIDEDLTEQTAFTTPVYALL